MNAFTIRDKNGNMSTPVTVFPGIGLVYEDYHRYTPSPAEISFQQGLVVHYCSEGRVEWAFGKERYCFLGKGDFSMRLSEMAEEPVVTYPLAHYHGISVWVDTASITSIRPMLASFRVDLDGVCERLRRRGGLYIARVNSMIGHIFGELDAVPESIRETYTRIKMLELLLFIGTLDLTERRDHPYYRQSDIQQIRAVKDYLTAHADSAVTLAELSVRFDIPLTRLKNCFREVYGAPVFAFLRGYRMQKAAALLATGDESVASIALQVGYSNASKFSAAFREEMGVSPLEYRRNARARALAVQSE